MDAKETLSVLVNSLRTASESLALAFVAHPRTTKSLERHGLTDAIAKARDIRLLDPMPYIDFMNIVTGAKLAITDSGGLQEETTYLGIPCLTLRDNTERPITVTLGTNQLVTAETLPDKVGALLAGGWKQGQCPPFWDGKTAARAAMSLRKFLAAGA